MTIKTWQERADADPWGSQLRLMQEEIDELRAALAALEKQEPCGFMWQHEETGRVGFADISQIGPWESGNPRLKIVSEIYTKPKDRP